MGSVTARLIFVLVPALVLAGAASFVHPIFAVLVFVAMCGFGLDMTEPRPDRGEK
jgi:hypothetical protein